MSWNLSLRITPLEMTLVLTQKDARALANSKWPFATTSTLTTNIRRLSSELKLLAKFRRLLLDFVNDFWFHETSGHNRERRKRIMTGIKTRVGEMIRSAYHYLRLIGLFVSAYWEFMRTGKNPDARCWWRLRELYWGTNGRFYDLVAFLLRLVNRPCAVDNRPGVLGVPDEIEIERAVNDLDTRGYHVFSRKLPEALCDELLTFAKTTASHPLIASSERLTGLDQHKGDPIVFDATNPRAAAYYFDPQQVMETHAAQKVLVDPWFLKVAQLYLRCRVVNPLIEMWWSTAFAKRPVSEAAQLYHFDMDYIRWVKFFVYLTDVTEDTGPHCYVVGSHLRKPKALLRDGRFRDDEIEHYYSQEEMVEIGGPKGTIFAADTRGFHKGKPLATGNRLIFEFEFAASLFGGSNFAPVKVTNSFAPEFIDVINRYPEIYPKFVNGASIAS